jgi:hypothetical protein
MKPRDPHDPTLLILIFVSAIIIAVWRALANLDLAHLAAAAGSLAPVLLGALALASALAMQRLLATNRTLQTRREVAVVPADDFDPKTDAVLRFAAELAGTERSVLGWLDRRASAVRVRLTCDDEGRLLYLLSVPEHSLKLLRGALGAYEGIELREVPEGVVEQRQGEGVASVRTELVLARSSLEPLARLSLDPDPLQPFASALSVLDPKKGERISICVDLLPASGRRRERLRRSLRRRARRKYGERPSLLERLEGNERSKGRPDPDRLLERRMVNEALEEKLRDAGTLFEAQILLRCRAADRARAKSAMNLILNGFAPFAAQNWLRARGLAIGGLSFLGSDMPLRRRQFDRRMDTGLFRPPRRAILTAREMAGFLKPPSVHCTGDNVVRAGALLAAAPKLPAFEPGRADVIPLGKVGTNGSERVLGVRAEDTFFSYIAGRSRYGKTELAIAQFVHLMRTGHGGFFLDPHGDALGRIRPYLSEPELRRRVVEIDLGPGHAVALPGWNLFQLGGEGGGEERVAAMVDAFSSVLEWGERSTRAINLTSHAAAALVSVAKVLPPELAPTIFQLPTLLSDANWREACVPFLPRASQRFWRDRFPLLSPEAITPVTNLVDRLRLSSAMSTLLGQSESSFRIREVMDKGLIVLACPGASHIQERLVANLMVFDLLHAARQRGEVAAGRRKPFWVFLDEVQSYDGGGSGSLAALLEQSAKFGLRAVLLNQNPERLSAQTLNALTTNRSHVLATALNSHAAALLTKEWGGQPSPAVMVGLPRFHFVTQVTHEGELSRPFALRGIRVEDVHDKPEANGQLPSAGAVERAEPAAVAEHLETLDDRILDHLKGLAPPAGEFGEPEEDETYWLGGEADGD